MSEDIVFMKEKFYVPCAKGVAHGDLRKTYVFFLQPFGNDYKNRMVLETNKSGHTCQRAMKGRYALPFHYSPLGIESNKKKENPT